MLPSTASPQRNILNEVWCSSPSEIYSCDVGNSQSIREGNQLNATLSNSFSSEDSNESRCDTPLDVETIVD